MPVFETDEQARVWAEDKAGDRDEPAVCWCTRCGAEEVSDPEQMCAECLVEDGGSDAGADWTGADTAEEDCHGI